MKQPLNHQWLFGMRLIIFSINGRIEKMALDWSPRLYTLSLHVYSLVLVIPSAIQLIRQNAILM